MHKLLCISKDCKDERLLEWLETKENVSFLPYSSPKPYIVYSLKDDKVIHVEEPLRLPAPVVFVNSYTSLRKHLIDHVFIGD